MRAVSEASSRLKTFNSNDAPQPNKEQKGVTMVRPASSKLQRGSSNSKGIGSVVIACAFIAGFFLGHIHAGLTNTAQENSFRGDALTTPQSGGGGSIGNARSVSSNDREYGNGWHSVEVFYGKTDHLERMLPPDQGEWFSQARQDELVATLLRGKRNGYFIDLAANDATILSNTYSLEKKLGWNGLCVEPNPIYWANLTYRDCQVVGAVAGNQRMEEVYFRFFGVGGGIIGSHNGTKFDNPSRYKSESTPRYTVPLTEILTRFNAPKTIDYLSLDVEGAEEFIMQNFPLNEYKISLMTVERASPSLRALFEKNGFSTPTRLTNWGETIWAHESVLASLDLSNIETFHPKNNKKKPVS